MMTSCLPAISIYRVTAEWIKAHGKDLEPIIEAKHRAAGNEVPEPSVLTRLGRQKAEELYARSRMFHDNRDHDVSCNHKVMNYSPDFSQAAAIWAKGSSVECIKLLTTPYLYGILGFVYMAVDAGQHDCTQDIETLFFVVLFRCFVGKRSLIFR